MTIIGIKEDSMNHQNSTSIVWGIDLGRLYPLLFVKQIINEIQNCKQS